MNQTQNYYEQNAIEFNNSTYTVDMTNLYQPFLGYIGHSGHILDLGCGSGRDALYFKNNGYLVDAIDYSIELVKLAQQQTGLEIQYASFYDLDEKQKYDGIWACASLLHCTRKRLPDVIQRIIQALKPNGVCYMSFKYGSEDREKDGRYFTDMNETQIRLLLQPFNITLLEQWITSDQRPQRSEQWLNILFRKNF